MKSAEVGIEIKRARELRGWSQEELGRRAGGVGQSTIDRIEKGAFKRFPSDLPRLSSALNVPVPEYDGYPVRSASPRFVKELAAPRDFPVYASAEGGEGEIILSPEAIDWISRPSPVIHAREAYGLLITGTSMVPEFKPGETAIVNPMLPVISDEVYIFYAERQGEARATIKHLRRATDEIWHVRQHNPAPKKPADFILPRKEWRWAHRVVGKHSRL